MLVNIRNWTLALGSVLCLPLLAMADDEAALKPKVLAENFDNPSGIAVQPGSGDVLVATHPGVLRVFRDADRRLGCTFEIAQYPTDIYGKGPKYEIGPLGLAFLGENMLVVGDGSRPDGEELVRVYEIGNKPLKAPISEADAVVTLGPITAGDASAKGEGNYYGIAVTKDAVFATANGDDTKGWIARAAIVDGKPSNLEPFIATKEKLAVDAPCGITVNSDGDLVVSQMGEISVPGDSLITIYDAKTGELKKQYETGLNDIVGIAYSPDGRLFGVDFSWMDPKAGALYELTIADDKCTPRKIADLDKPTAIAFDADGAALVTIFGTAEDGSDLKPGKLLSFSPDQLKPAKAAE